MSEFKEITLTSRQSLSDIAVQEYGALEALPLLVQDNVTLAGLNAVVAPGTILKIRKTFSKINQDNVAIAAKLQADKKLVVSNAPAAASSNLYVAGGYWQYNLLNNYAISNRVAILQSSLAPLNP